MHENTEEQGTDARGARSSPDGSGALGVAPKRAADGERASNRRKQVLDAAQACFARSGFHGASMAEISKAAGMSAGHIYNYFDGKDAIIAAFVQENVERTTAILRDIERHDDVLQALIDGIGVGVSEILDGGKGALQLEIFAEAARNPGIAALVQDADRATLQKLHDLLVSGRQARGLPVERSLIAGRCEAIASMMEGLYLRAVQNPALDQATLTKAIQTAITPLVFSP